MASDVVRLRYEHAGSDDPTYLARRDEIACLSYSYQEGAAVPRVDYTAEEHGLWPQVLEHLRPLHVRYACREYLEAWELIELPLTGLPQLEDINLRLSRNTGFHMLPVAGFVSPRTFMSYLARDIFLSTQYVRHHSSPLFTPEPDVIHELVGHSTTLSHPAYAELSRLFGQATLRARSEEEVVRISRVFWYTMESGAVVEDGLVKAYGSALLSSPGELSWFVDNATFRDFDLEAAARTPFDSTKYQPLVFLAPSFDVMLRDVKTWLQS